MTDHARGPNIPRSAAAESGLDEPLKREIAGRMGCKIVKVYKDHGVSGDGM